MLAPSGEAGHLSRNGIRCGVFVRTVFKYDTPAFAVIAQASSVGLETLRQRHLMLYRTSGRARLDAASPQPAFCRESLLRKRVCQVTGPSQDVICGNMERTEG